MTELTDTALPTADALLERAVRYGQGSVAAIAPHHLSRPTPCAAWDVGALLRHLTDSVGLLLRGIDTGRLDETPTGGAPTGGAGGARSGGRAAASPGARRETLGESTGEPAGESAARLVTAFHAASERLLGAWRSGAARRDPLRVGGLPLAVDTVGAVGAIEIAVHGWDVAMACGHRRPMGDGLANDILRLARLLVGDGDRYPMFAAPLDVSPQASPSERLVAFLGRGPWP